jgi:hypothetical protein
MALYFFNEFDGDYKIDDLGIELPTREKARLEAVRYAGETMRDQPDLDWRGAEFRVEVTDAGKVLLFTVIVVGIEVPESGNSINPALKAR